MAELPAIPIASARDNGRRAVPVGASLTARPVLPSQSEGPATPGIDATVDVIAIANAIKSRLLMGAPPTPAILVDLSD